MSKRYELCCEVLIESISESLDAFNDVECYSDVDFLYWDIFYKLDTLKSFKRELLFQCECGGDDLC